MCVKEAKRETMRSNREELAKQLAAPPTTEDSNQKCTRLQLLSPLALHPIRKHSELQIISACRLEALGQYGVDSFLKVLGSCHPESFLVFHNVCENRTAQEDHVLPPRWILDA